MYEQNPKIIEKLQANVRSGIVKLKLRSISIMFVGPFDIEISAMYWTVDQIKQNKIN